MGDCTFTKIVSIVRDIANRYDQLVDDLDQKMTPLLLADDLIGMFRKDTKKIENDYSKDRLTRSEASEKLKHLRMVAQKIDKHILDLKNILFQMNEKSRNVFGKILETPREGVPFHEIIGEIDKYIGEIEHELKKKRFGVLKIDEANNTSKISKQIQSFLDDYSAGVIALPKKHRDLLDDFSGETKVNFEIKEVTGNLICTFEGYH